MGPSCRITVERPPVGTPYRDATFSLTCEVDGVQAGKLMAWRREEDGQSLMHVSNVVVGPRYRRRGLGTQMYEAAAHVACDAYGAPLSSDKHTSRSKYAEGFWRKQARKKRAVCVGESGAKRCRVWALRCPAPASLAAW